MVRIRYRFIFVAVIIYPSNKHLRGKWLILAHNSILQSITTRKLKWQELEANSQMVSTSKESKYMHAHSFAYAHTAFFALIQFRASYPRTRVTHSGLCLFTSIKAIKNNHSPTSPYALIEVLFPGGSKLCMVTVKTNQNMIMKSNLVTSQ